ncbi:hypothetical protein DFJ63DRAFT_314024 [Scheffersomyces coipomensis]|uniref:uncharacterized protein n=1 Tax=Scheffersomyces coipomensis TaxID=1788519 RepID=UPI00315D82F7
MTDTTIAPSNGDDHLNVLNSPSSTISSIHSDSSTGKLIKGLTTEQTIDNSLNIPKKTSQVNNKKPIKFTVRKVSHEPIKSPLPSPVLQNSNNHNSSRTSSTNHKSSHQQQQSQITTVHLVEHLEEQNLAKENEKLRIAEYKYEQYQERIIKIDKEIEFLLNLLPPYNVEIDYSTRTKINKAIEKLKMKQDEIEKKKYSLGITISRLWRGHEESDIWIRNFSNQ